MLSECRQEMSIANIQANSNLEALKLNPIINMHLHVQTIFGSGSNSLQSFILKTSTITSEKQRFFFMKKKYAAGY